MYSSHGNYPRREAHLLEYRNTFRILKPELLEKVSFFQPLGKKNLFFFTKLFVLDVLIVQTLHSPDAEIPMIRCI